MSAVQILFHALAIVQYMAATYYNANHVVVPNTERFKNFHAYGGLAKYLTLWNMIIQSAFFWICLINDFVGSNDINPKPKPAIRKFKDMLYCTIAFPLSAFVAVTFWGLYAIDRELVLPKILDNYFPTWLNHIMHTNILIFSLVELICSFRVYPSRKQGLSILISFMFVYLIWIFIIYGKSGQWVYPVMEVLNWPQRILFFAGLMFLVQGFYLLGEILNKFIWGAELKSISNSSGKKSERKKVESLQTVLLDWREAATAENLKKVPFRAVCDTAQSQPAPTANTAPDGSAEGDSHAEERQKKVVRCQSEP